MLRESEFHKSFVQAAASQEYAVARLTVGFRRPLLRDRKTLVRRWHFDRNRRRLIMRSDIVPGGIFPDYELPDHTGELRKLSKLQGCLLYTSRCV